MLHPVAAEVIAAIDEMESKALSPDELVVFMRGLCEKIAANPEVERQLPPGTRERLQIGADDLEKATANEKVASRNFEIARQNRNLSQAKFDRLADQLLNNQEDPEKGN